MKALIVEPARHGLVQETAERFGFKSIAHFSRAFHRRFGCTPSEAQTLGSQSVGGRRFTEWLAQCSHAPDAEAIRSWMTSAKELA